MAVDGVNIFPLGESFGAAEVGLAGVTAAFGFPPGVALAAGFAFWKKLRLSADGQNHHTTGKTTTPETYHYCATSQVMASNRALCGDHRCGAINSQNLRDILNNIKP